MELKFKNSSMTCFQIVQLDQESKKYIMDTSTMSPKSYYWGFKTDTITVGMVEIEKNNNQFEIKPTTPVSTTMAVHYRTTNCQNWLRCYKAAFLLKTILVSKCY